MPLDRRFLHVNLDVTERCNLECRHCPHVHARGLLEQPARMDSAFMAQLAQEVFPHAARVSLSSLHEPLMAPMELQELMEIVGHCKVPLVDIVTNGLLLTEELAEALLRGTHLIRFSGEGASPETYEDMRRGGRFSVFREKVRMLTDLRRRMGVTTKVTLTACLVNQNVHESAAMVELAHQLGVDSLELRLTKISNVVDLHQEDQICHQAEQAGRHLQAARQKAQALGFTVNLPPTFEEIQAANLPRPQYTNCLYPWREVQITPRGGVTPCCMWHSTSDLGNMAESTFEEVWNGTAFRRLRWEFERSALSRPGCINCEVHYNMADPRWWRTYEFL